MRIIKTLTVVCSYRADLGAVNPAPSSYSKPFLAALWGIAGRLVLPGCCCLPTHFIPQSSSVIMMWAQTWVLTTCMVRLSRHLATLLGLTVTGRGPNTYPETFLSHALLQMMPPVQFISPSSLSTDPSTSIFSQMSRRSQQSDQAVAKLNRGVNSQHCWVKSELIFSRSFIRHDHRVQFCLETFCIGR